MQTLKAIFCVKVRENDVETAHNAAQVGLELVLNYYRESRFPNKLVSSIVEIVVYSLTKHDLKPKAEELLELITKTTGREGLRRIFEIELINSSKLYQVFLHWLDQQQPSNSVSLQSKPKTPSPQKKDEIYVEDNQTETHTLHDDSFSQSITPPKRQEDMPKRQSPIGELRHSFDQALEEAGQHDTDQLSQILTTEGDLDHPNFGVRKENDVNLPAEKHDVNETIPTLAQFKQSLRGHYGAADPNEFYPKESNKKTDLQERRPTRTVLGERNFEERQNFPPRELVVGYQGTVNQENKENFEGADPMTKIQQNNSFVVNKQARDDSAEKWKGKYIQEKQRLQQTIELLEKANSSYFGQVTEKTDIVTKLNEQRQISENLMNKFNE